MPGATGRWYPRDLCAVGTGLPGTADLWHRIHRMSSAGREMEFASCTTGLRTEWRKGGAPLPSLSPQHSVLSPFKKHSVLSPRFAGLLHQWFDHQVDEEVRDGGHEGAGDEEHVDGT